MNGYLNYKDELYHHGILGMKWGVRRYQSYSENPKLSGKKPRKAKHKANNSDYKSENPKPKFTVGKPTGRSENPKPKFTVGKPTGRSENPKPKFTVGKPSSVSNRSISEIARDSRRKTGEQLVSQLEAVDKNMTKILVGSAATSAAFAVGMAFLIKALPG